MRKIKATCGMEFMVPDGHPDQPEWGEGFIEEYIQDPQDDYRDLRRAEYPPLADLGDALYWQSKGDSSKMEEYLAKCEAVKLKYPKPL